MNTEIPEVSLPLHKKSRRDYAGLQGFPLSEKNMPFVSVPDGTVSDIYDLLLWLAVERSARYAVTIVIVDGKRVARTRCNAYFYDYMQLRGLFAFRNWWHKAIIQKNDFSVRKYGNLRDGGTFGELNPNMLYDILPDYGRIFGWEQVHDAANLQDIVNRGAAGFIIAKNINPADPGHVSVVIPEYPEKGHFALRSNYIVIAPLQSQAGGVNKMIFSDTWYKARYFNGQYSFWVNNGE